MADVSSSIDHQAVCGDCKVSQPLEEFSQKRASKRGIQSRCKSCKADRQRVERRRNRVLALQILGGVCVRCGFSDPRALQIDHINGGGRQEDIRGRDSTWINRQVARGNTDGFQLLCANCNWIKLHVNEEWGNFPWSRVNAIREILA